MSTDFRAKEEKPLEIFLSLCYTISMKKSFLTIILSFLLLLLPLMGVGCSKIETVFTEYDTYVSYKDVRYGEHERHYFDISLPKDKTRAGLILFIHGGGWMSGDKSVYEGMPAYWCAQQGFATVALNYRYADLEEEIDVFDILDDITLCLLKAKTIASEHNLALDKMLLTGGSAGAHLSLFYAYTKADIAPVQPAAVCSFAGPTDLTDVNYYKESPLKEDLVKMLSSASGYAFKETDVGTLTTAKPFLLQASPIAYVRENTVPTILCHGEKDDVVPVSNALTLAQKLQELNVQHELLLYPNSGHGLESDPTQAKRADELMLEYAKTYLV